MGDLSALNFQRFPLWMRGLFAPDRWRCCLVLLLFASACGAQVSSTSGSKESAAQNQLDVNWLYGAYIPKEAPVIPLNGKQRYQLFIRQSFTTPGIYIKTGFFAIHDQVTNSPPEWGDGFEGFAKRLGTRQTQFYCKTHLRRSEMRWWDGSLGMTGVNVMDSGRALVMLLRETS